MKRISLIFTLLSLFTPSVNEAFDTNVENIAYVELNGTVLDERTSSPVIGAHVLVTWHANTYGFHSTTPHCLRLASAQTDSDGKFLIAANVSDVFRAGLHNQFIDIRIHKEDMTDASSGDNEDGRALKVFSDEKRVSTTTLLQGALLTKRHLQLTAKLVPSSLDAHDRLRYLLNLASPERKCETTGDLNSIQQYFSAIAEEAKKLAKTKYEKALASIMVARARMPASPGQSAGDFEPSLPRTFDSNDLDSRDYRDYTILMDAAAVGDVDKVNALLRAGANSNRTAGTSFDLLGGDSALTIAIEKYGWEKVNRPQNSQRYVSVIETLLRHPATDPNIRRRRIDYTPLMKALERGQADVVSLLLSVGADANLMANRKQFSALQIATKRAMSGQNSAGVPMPSASIQFSILLAHKKLDLNVATTYDGNTALTQAASLANVKIVEQLLEAGADPNAPNLAKRPPLIVAVENALLNPTRANYAETVQAIAGAVGVRKAETYGGKTAMQLAQEGGRSDLVRILQDK